MTQKVLYSTSPQKSTKPTYSAELYRPLVPGPLLVIQLVLEGWSELHGDVAGLVELPALVLCLALVQPVIRPLHLGDRDGGLPPEGLSLRVVWGVHRGLFHDDSVVVRLAPSVERLAGLIEYYKSEG